MLIHTHIEGVAGALLLFQPLTQILLTSKVAFGNFCKLLNQGRVAPLKMWQNHLVDCGELLCFLKMTFKTYPIEQ